MPRNLDPKRTDEHPIAGDLTVRGRVNELLDGRATAAELVAEGVLVDLTTGPTAKAWSDALPDGEPVYVTRASGTSSSGRSSIPIRGRTSTRSSTTCSGRASRRRRPTG